MGAGLRRFRVGEVDLVTSYPAHATPPFAAGSVLVPWPNRVEDGLWSLDAEPQQLDITEPDRHHAIHGLLRFSPYSVEAQTESAITLAATIFPQHGYRFLVDTTVRYELVDDELRVTHSLTNATETRAPVAMGAHPYLQIGGVSTDDLVLKLAASTRFSVTDRLMPVTEEPVDGTIFDLRGGVPVEQLELDDLFGGISRSAGDSSHSLTAPDGRSVALWADSSFGFVQVFVTRVFPCDDGVTTAIAIEPMTAPANAFNTGIGLRWLEPGETWTLSWGIRHTDHLSTFSNA